jgi:hypothetical protein
MKTSLNRISSRHSASSQFQQRQFVAWWKDKVTPHRGERTDFHAGQHESRLKQVEKDTGTKIDSPLLDDVPSSKSLHV